MRNNEIHDIEFMGTCMSPGIAEVTNLKGRKFSYKKIVKMIKEKYPEMYYNLALEYYNPWEHHTKKIHYDGRYYLCMNHSAIEYLFLVIV